jgi:hypothetical protein
MTTTLVSRPKVYALLLEYAFGKPMSGSHAVDYVQASASDTCRCAHLRQH